FVADGLGQLLLIGQLARPQQVRDGLERLGRGQLRHRVAAIEPRARPGIDLRDGGDVGDHPVQALADFGLAQASLRGSTSVSVVVGGWWASRTSKSKTEVSNRL